MTNEQTEDYRLFQDYPDVVSVDELQEMLKIGRNTALKLLGSDSIQNFRIGNRYKILKISVIDYVQTKTGVQNV